MKTDFDLFLKYDNELAGNYNKAYHSIDLIRTSLNNNLVEMLDIDSCDSLVKEVIEYLKLKKRFIYLQRKANEKLSISKDGFKISDHVFLSLDEVEKALNNKAFL